VCWEFTSTLEKIVSNTLKDRLKATYQRHHELQRQERDAYEEVKLDARNRPDKFLSIVVDGMDQNTTMVPKMRQTVKNIEGRYVKTHLCRILVHGWGLCCDLWIDAHHRHDSNQVVTSIMQVLNYVHNEGVTFHQFYVFKLTTVDGKIRISTYLAYVRHWWIWATLKRLGLNFFWLDIHTQI
jgi:N-acetylmuramoyl-L-alanine amidase